MIGNKKKHLLSNSVSVIEPGVVNTAINEHMKAQGLGGHEEVLQNPDINDLDKMLTSWLDHLDVSFPSLFGPAQAQQPEDIADLILRVATEEKPHFRYQSSKVGTPQAPAPGSRWSWACSTP